MKRLPLQNHHFVITGRFPGVTTDELIEKFKALGAIPERRVFKRTRYLFMGKGKTQEKLRARALMLGTHVLDVEQTLALADGKPLKEVLAMRQVEDLTQTPEDVLGKLRQVLLSPDPLSAWSDVCECVDQAPPDALDMVLDYALQHTAQWEFPVDFLGTHEGGPLHRLPGHPPESWLPLLFRAKDHPKLKLLRVLNFHNAKLPANWMRSLFQCESLQNIAYIDLCRSSISSATVERLSTAAFLPNLRYVGVGEANSFYDWLDASTPLQQWLSMPALKGLEYLDLSGVALGSWLVSSLATHLTSLTHLNLHECEFKKKEYKKLASAPYLRKLKCLVLHKGGWYSFLRPPSEEHLLGFFTQLQHEQLETLCLEGLSISESIVQAIGENSALANLKTLFLGWNEINARDIRYLLESPVLSSLEQLNAENCLVSEHEIDSLNAFAQERGVALHCETLSE